MSLNLTGLADVAERSLQQITEIADDRRQTLDGAKHHAHVDVRLNELEESALSSLLMPMLPVHLLGTEERGARATGDEESMEGAARPGRAAGVARAPVCTKCEKEPRSFRRTHYFAKTSPSRSSPAAALWRRAIVCATPRTEL